MKANKFRIFATLLVVLLAIFPKISVFAQENENPIASYKKTEVMIPMRDSVRLYTAIYSPKDEHLISPILVIRSPYSLGGYGKVDDIKLAAFYDVFLKKNYVLVFQNVRGTMMSEGEFEHIRPVNPQLKPGETDDATDSYDTVEWLLENTPNNGNVGFMGVSYNGFYATVAGLCGHPAIKAVSPQAPVTDWFLGDDAHNNGAFTNSIYTFGARQFRKRPGQISKTLPALVKPEGDYYDYFLDKGPLSNLFKDFGDSLQFFKDIQEHPNYDGFWQRRSPLYTMKEVQPAFMVVGGWYDREDLYGTLATFSSLRRLSPETDAFLVMGPWAHGSWNKLDYNHLGGTWFGDGASRHFNEKIITRFFDRYLRNRYELQIPTVQYLPSGETRQKEMEGVQTDGLWETSEVWPPAHERVSYYLGNDHNLQKQPVKAKKGKQTYYSSTDRPVRCVGKVMDSWCYDEVTGDQSYLTWRSDVLTFEGEELTDTLKVVGSVNANLNVSITTTDADIVVKLIDVRPDGYQMLVRWSVLPLRFRSGFTTPLAVVPGEKMGIRLQMDEIAHYFLPGHKLMVQIQSSMFPWIAMNPQTFVENPYLAKRKDYRPSEITVYTNRNESSYISLPVVK